MRLYPLHQTTNSYHNLAMGLALGHARGFCGPGRTVTLGYQRTFSFKEARYRFHHLAPRSSKPTIRTCRPPWNLREQNGRDDLSTSAFACVMKQPKPVVRSIAQHEWAAKRFGEDQSQSVADVSEWGDASVT